jgi:hypothetical protein
MSSEENCELGPLVSNPTTSIPSVNSLGSPVQGELWPSELGDVRSASELRLETDHRLDMILVETVRAGHILVEWTGCEVWE